MWIKLLWRFPKEIQLKSLPQMKLLISPSWLAFHSWTRMVSALHLPMIIYPLFYPSACCCPCYCIIGLCIFGYGHRFAALGAVQAQNKVGCGTKSLQTKWKKQDHNGYRQNWLGRKDGENYNHPNKEWAQQATSLAVLPDVWAWVWWEKKARTFLPTTSKRTMKWFCACLWGLLPSMSDSTRIPWRCKLETRRVNCPTGPIED